MVHRRAPVALLALLVLPAAALALPAWATEPALPAAARTVTLDDTGAVPLLEPANPLLPLPPGTLVHASFVYGPFAVPPGWDLNRLAVNVPLQTGLVTHFGYRLVDAATGVPFTNLQLHVHHGIWFRYNPTRPDSFLFGTGEERTEVDFDAVAAAQPAGPRYGMLFDPTDPQVLLLMLHNKEPTARVATLFVDVTFVFGTAAQVKAATDCGPLPALLDASCVAGQDYHELDPYLWGAVFDVPRQPDGPGTYTYPPGNTYTSPVYLDPGRTTLAMNLGLGVPVGLPLNATYVASVDGTVVNAGSHLHQNGVATIVANLGPAGSGCEADLDHDGLPGVTLFRGMKMDHDPAATPFSEDYQMGITQNDWRAPVHKGDRLQQFAVYANKDVASYSAMTFVAWYLDPLQPPPARSAGCPLGDVAPVLLHGGGDPTVTVPNRAWDTPLLPLCGPGLGPACDGPDATPAERVDAPAVAIAGESYVPGDRGLVAPLGAPVRVKAGQSITFVNADTATVVRHTVTSCDWPCNGPYVANYPQPNGLFDSGRLGNMDPMDFGHIPPDVQWSTPADLPPGMYSYFCRLHPFMRGAFEVVP